MHTLPEEQFDCDEQGVYRAEASTLGFAPGEWPLQFFMKIKETTSLKLEPMRFERAEFVLYEGEVAYARYLAADGGIEAIVYND
jgi:hypothetical protein